MPRNSQDPIFVIAGGADVSPKWPDDKKSFIGTRLEWMAKKWESLWNNTWKLDPNPNSHWIGELWEFLQKQFGPDSEIVTLHWSGSAFPLAEKEAKKVLREQLSKVAAQYPWRPIIAICKSLSGPYLARALQEEPGLTVTQFISLGSPWWRHDTIPDNAWDAVFVESDGDIFYKIGHLFRFLNFWFKAPKRKDGSKEPEPTKITLEKPTHGGLNYDTQAWSIREEWPKILEWLSPTTMYQLLAMIIKKGLSWVNQQSDDENWSALADTPDTAGQLALV